MPDSRTSIVTIVPYVTFSLFHVLTFLRTTVLPMVFPAANSSATKDAGANAQAMPAKTAKFIQGWVKQNYDPAMRFVAYSEVLVFVRVLVGAVLLRNSLLAPLLYVHFLRLRFYMSSFTRTSFQHVGGVMDGVTSRSECPPFVRKAYLTLMDLVHRYANTVFSIPQGQHAQANGPATGTTGTGGSATTTATGAGGSAQRRT